MTSKYNQEQSSIRCSTSQIPVFQQAICLLQDYLEHLGYQAQIHFELEGCYRILTANGQHKKLNFTMINQFFRSIGIDGEIVNEYWQNQWEYVSLFNGQSPLKEAMNLHRVITSLPQWFNQFFQKDGLVETLINPVVWSGDRGKLAFGSQNIFSHDTRAVHIPNAVQLNVSVLNNQGENLIAKDDFGEYLQYCFLRTSLECSLLYLPVEAAFDRLALKTRYGLAQELCSPIDISGGHQGSVALYKKFGKHNQLMGEEPLLYDKNSNILAVHHNWQKTARIEHRLGAASIDYNPFINVIYGLLNIIDAVNAYEKKQHVIPNEVIATALPPSLYSDVGKNGTLGAIDLFNMSSWFSDGINLVQEKQTGLKANSELDCSMMIGDKIKQIILNNYQVNFVKA